MNWSSKPGERNLLSDFSPTGGELVSFIGVGSGL